MDDDWASTTRKHYKVVKQLSKTAQNLRSLNDIEAAINVEDEVAACKKDYHAAEIKYLAESTDFTGDATPRSWPWLQE
jgi:hypothetical protein